MASLTRNSARAVSSSNCDWRCGGTIGGRGRLEDEGAGGHPLCQVPIDHARRCGTSFALYGASVPAVVLATFLVDGGSAIRRIRLSGTWSLQWLAMTSRNSASNSTAPPQGTQ